MSGFKSSASNQKWVCCQIGAREHYAIARALRHEDRLEVLYTDFWAGPKFRKLSGGKFRSLATRYHPELGPVENGKHKVKNRDQQAKVISWNLRSLWWEKILRGNQKLAKSGQKIKTGNRYHGYIEVGRRFAMCVREDLKCRPAVKLNSIFFAYDTAALEALEWCREQGLKTILNQMDPNRVEVEMVRAEEKQWPGWASEAIEVPEEYFVRREQEWRLADRVLVNSEFCRQALLQQGVSSEKLVVVPLCYEAKAEAENKLKISDFKFSLGTPLRILFLGQVILRKGIQYLMSAARLLEKDNIHFDVVGSVGISADAVASAPRNLTFHGRAGREATAAWYQKSHVFVLPTLSDGFALTQLEAMAHGLPVIATPCCGAVVSDETDGFIVPPRNVEAMVRCLLRYQAEPELLKRHSTAALVKARQFTLQGLAENLRKVENSLKN